MVTIELGDVLVGLAEHDGTALARLQLRHRERLPPFPDMDTVKTAIVPTAPLLDLDGNDDEQVTLMLRTFDSAVRSRLGLRSYASDPRQADRYAEVLREMALLLAFEEQAPAAWIEFSLGLWRTGINEVIGTRTPTLNWMFGPKRFEKQREWFAEEAPQLCQRRVLLSESHRELMRRYTALQMNLLYVNLPTARSVTEAVQHHFPGDTYELLTRSAEREALVMQTDIDNAVKAGAFLW